MNVEDIIDKADMIISEYAFLLKGEDQVQVINLNHPDEVCILNKNGEMLESSMDHVQLLIVKDYFRNDSEFLFDEDVDS